MPARTRSRGKRPISPRRSCTINALSAAYSVTGRAANIFVGRKLAAVAASYAITGKAANLTKSTASTITALPASFAISGKAATLTKTSAAATYTLTALPASFLINGAFFAGDAILDEDGDRILDQSGNAITDGAAGAILDEDGDRILDEFGNAITDNAGVSAAGGVVNLLVGRKVGAIAAAYLITGKAANLIAVTSGVTGALTAIEGADDATIGGTVTGVAGTLTATEAADDATIGATSVWQARLTATEGADDATINGGIYATGSVTAVEGADDATINGGIYATGTLTALETPTRFQAMARCCRQVPRILDAFETADDATMQAPLPVLRAGLARPRPLTLPRLTAASMPLVR